MCFLITAVVDILVVVQTGAIDLPVKGRGGQIMSEKHTGIYTNTELWPDVTI